MNSTGMQYDGENVALGPTGFRVALVEDPVLTVQASGEIDLSNADDLQKAMDDAARRSPGGFVLDLSETTYVDSAGMAVVLTAHQHLKQSNGLMGIVIRDPMLREIFDIVNISSFPGIRLCEDCSAAYDYVSGQVQAPDL